MSRARMIDIDGTKLENEITNVEYSQIVGGWK